jgi:putative phage-type endonuclease
MAKLPDPMGREEWLRNRRKGIGSSDAAAVMGLSRWSNPVKVWAQKTDNLPEDPESRRMRLGRRFEPIIAEEFQALHPELEVVDPGVISVVGDPDYVRCSPDRLLRSPGGKEFNGVLEIKRSSSRRHDWYDMETDEFSPVVPKNEPPIDHICQAQHQIYAMGVDHCWLVALIDSTDWYEWKIERDDDFIQVMLNEYATFWEYVKSGTEPPAEPSINLSKTIRKLHPNDNGLEVMAPGEALHWDDRLEEIKMLQKHLKEEREEIEARFHALIGPNSYARLPNGVSYSFKTQHNGGYTVAPFDFRALRRSAAKKKGKR